ncbi:MAG: hypothetical protein U5L98_09940 [Halomonas sp.]|uniref:hypothetical protein n=1 Tax=Halomonas sp. TaxID=1486246 RepID=UPI002ACEE561|nr:hypothetical protein [Halomonas sp.]MDZ7852945.1 hypothetical protein [Halomonas sp.]
MDLSNLSNQWYSLIQRHRRGLVRKQEIIDLLRAGEPVPPECNSVIADIIEGNTKFKTGPGRQGMEKHLSESPVARELLRQMVDNYQAIFEDPDYDLHDHGWDAEIIEEIETEVHSIRSDKRSGRDYAKDLAAVYYGISHRRVEEYISKK